MPEVQEQEVKAPVGSVEGRPGVTVVTQENFHDYVNEKMGVVPAVESEENTENPDPEAAAKQELAELETKQAEEQAKAAEPKEGDIDGANVFFNGKWVKKHDFNYRLHLKTEETKKEAQARIDAAAAEAKAAREEREAIARERDELKAKYEPKPQELGPEPDPAKFTDINEYAKALKEWTAASTRQADEAARQEQQAKKAAADALKAFNDRQEAIKAEVPDYAEKIANSQVNVSNEMRDAILESEVGPAMLYYLAEHPETAQALGQMTVKKMLREFGKIEASLGSADKPQTKSTAGARIAAVAEISKAPAPISPLRGSHAVDGLKFDSQGNWTGTPEEWKAARQTGKIK